MNTNFKNPEILNISEKKLVGLRMEMSLSENKTFALWNGFMKTRHLIENTATADLYAVQEYAVDYFENFNIQKTFQKWAAVAVTELGIIPNQCSILHCLRDYTLFFILQEIRKALRACFISFLTTGCQTQTICLTTGRILNCWETNTKKTAPTQKKLFTSR